MLANGARMHYHIAVDDNTRRRHKMKFKDIIYKETATLVSEFTSALSGLKLDKQQHEDLISKVKKNYGKGLVEGKAREEAGKVKYLMMKRFEQNFRIGDDKWPRDWTKNHDIPAIAKTSRSSTLRLLSMLAAIRLDGETDTIWETLVEATKETSTSHHLLAGNTWKEVPDTKTLTTPAQCNSLWDEFEKETEYLITQASHIQANERKRRKELHDHILRTTGALVCVAGSAAAAGAIIIAAGAEIAHRCCRWCGLGWGSHF
ncbi:hypothetical protein QVD17_24641 [Tagetes erecta]|uniref:Sey1/RHD3-like three-helix bundle domain-containing protein n=1 Tax=Tagetes erecta TaxID=13708 RepID=A0AAD8KI19_TARER|nr:hypothetical protein QVD17_24641 [Tagetes erecta]